MDRENRDKIKEFLSASKKVHDPDQDDYERNPFDEAIKAGKNTPIYNAHSYHTKVPYQGIIAFIEHYTEPGDLLLDPFCGSGMTGVAALLCKSGPRKVILNDLSPAAVHIAKNYCTPCDVNELKKEFDRIKDGVKSEFDWLYETFHEEPSTRGKIPAIIQYTIWSDVYWCKPKKQDAKKHPINPGGCSNELILWDVAVDKESAKVREFFQCPYCHEKWKKAELQLIKSIPVITNYVYIDPITKKKRRGEHRTTDFELSRLKEIEEKQIPYWYPTAKLSKQSEMYIRCALHLKSIERACDFYTKRNLWALAKLLYEINKIDNSLLRARLLFAFTGVVNTSSRMNAHNMSGQARPRIGTLYIPSLHEEASVSRLFNGKSKSQSVLASIQKTFHKADCLFLAKHAGNLEDIEDNSIDYIFADPPFGSNIFYADCSFLWESWLGEFTDDSKEAVWNKSRKPEISGKTLDDYKQLMAESFKEMARVLKPSRWATVIFSNSDDRVWEAIQEAAYQAGFVIYGGKEFDKIQRSFKGIRGEKGKEKVISKDVLLNMHKQKTPQLQNGQLRKIDDVEGFVVQQIHTFLQYLASDVSSTERTIEALTRAVQRRVIEQGYSMRGFSAGYVSDVLHEARRKGRLIDVEGVWYIAGGEKSAVSVKDGSSAVLWLTNLLSRGAKRLDEIDPLWKEETVKAEYKGEKGLQELLSGFFIQDPDGTYRLPDDHEKHILKGQQEVQKFREIERYLSGKSGREPSTEEKLSWIEMLAEREHWQEILDIEKHFPADLQWQTLSGGKDAQSRIRLAKAMMLQKKESTRDMKQKTLF